MSYILEALRKAERDRNLGRTPSLGDVTAPVSRPPSRRPSTRTMALLALVAVLSISTVMMWRRGPAPEPATAPAVASTEPVPAAQPVPVAPPPAAPVAPAPEIAAVPANPSGSMAAERMLAPDVPADSIDDLMDEPEVAPVVPEVAPMQPDIGGAALVADVPNEPSSDEVPDPMVEAGEPPPLEEAPIASDVPLLRDMPADYRGAFPALRVDVHVYDDDPARRWVMVNGHKAAEGSTLTEGPTVSRISPEGIVFDFRGRSVLFPLNR